MERMPVDSDEAQHSPCRQRHHEPVANRCRRTTASLPLVWHGSDLLLGVENGWRGNMLAPLSSQTGLEIAHARDIVSVAYKEGQTAATGQLYLDGVSVSYIKYRVGFRLKGRPKEDGVFARTLQPIVGFDLLETRRERGEVIFLYISPLG